MIEGHGLRVGDIDCLEGCIVDASNSRAAVVCDIGEASVIKERARARVSVLPETELSVTREDTSQWL